VAGDRAAVPHHAGTRSGSGWVRRCATVLTQALELARKRGLIHGDASGHGRRAEGRVVNRNGSLRSRYRLLVLGRLQSPSLDVPRPA
jgi:hypothetical protein